MKQLQLCYIMYVGDNNDRLPINLSSSTSDTLAATGSWIAGDAQTDTSTTNIKQGKLYPYNTQTAIYVCPANTKMIVSAPTMAGPGTQTPQTRTCSIEYSMGGGNPPGSTVSRVVAFGTYDKLAKVHKSVAKVVFIDENESSVGDGCFGCYPVGSYPTVNIWWNLAGSRHTKGCTFSFADGHTEYWKWHGKSVLVYVSGDQPGDPVGTSDDMPRMVAAGSEYYPVN
jgi:prepilin-type processing-associated H-X9-DG protein